MSDLEGKEVFVIGEHGSESSLPEASNFRNSPFHAQALELAARENEVLAELKEKFGISSIDISDDTKKQDARELELHRDYDKILAQWLRLEAKMFRWQAEKHREADSTQKSQTFLGKSDQVLESLDKAMSKCFDLEGVTMGQLRDFEDSPLMAQAMDNLSKYHAIRAEMATLPKIQYSTGIMIDPAADKRKKLYQSKSENRAAFYRLQQKLLEWKAKQLRDLDKTQKSFSAMADQVLDILGSSVNLAKARYFGDSLMDKVQDFQGTPYLAQAMELLGKEQGIESEMSQLKDCEFSGGVCIDPDKTKREKLQKEIDQCRADFYQLQQKMFDWRAKELRQNDKTQKAMKNPKGTGVDVDTGMMPQMDSDISEHGTTHQAPQDTSQPFKQVRKAEISKAAAEKPAAQPAKQGQSAKDGKGNKGDKGSTRPPGSRDQSTEEATGGHFITIAGHHIFIQGPRPVPHVRKGTHHHVYDVIHNGQKIGEIHHKGEDATSAKWHVGDKNFDYKNVAAHHVLEKHWAKRSKSSKKRA